MKDNFKLLSELSREIRTHMNSIMGFSFLLKGNGLTEINNDYSNNISCSCNQLLMLIESFFEYALLDYNNFDVRPAKIRLDNILEALFNDLQSETNINLDKEIVLTSANHNSVNPEVSIDSVKVLRAFRSLIHVAVNDTKSGSIKIGYECTSRKITFYILTSSQDCDKYKELLEMEVIDESVSETSDIKSTINIVLAKKIIQLLCGSIWVDVCDSKGPGIYFSVPVEDPNYLASSTNEFFITISQRRMGSDLR